MTLLEELAKVLNNAIYAGDPMRLESCTGQAHAILSLIQNHPETVERRRKDFEAGRLGDLSRGWKYDFFNEYLAAEKEP